MCVCVLRFSLTLPFCLLQSIDVPCVECGSPDDSGGDDATIVICDQCSRGFHLRCLRSEAQPDLEAPADVAWVCPRCTK